MSNIIRPVQEQDAKPLADLYRYYVEKTPVTLEYVPPDVDEFIRRIRAAGDRYPWLVCESDGVVAGYAYASEYHERAAYQWCVKLSVYAAKGMEGKRLGTALYSGVLRLLREQGYYKAYASVTLPNERSVALHRSLGFEQYALIRGTAYKLGRWFDVAHFEKRLLCCDGAPDAPKPLSGLSRQTVDGIFEDCSAIMERKSSEILQ